MRSSTLHSFTVVFLFLNLGQSGCSTAESGEKEAATTHSDDAGVPDQDAATRDSPAGSAGDAGEPNDSATTEDAAGGGSGSKNGDGGPLSDAGADAMAESGGTEQDNEAQPGTFTHIYDRAFKTCRLQCHGMGFSKLDMSSREAAYRSLVNQPSNPDNMECAPLGLKRVEPGKPEQSLLYLKLNIDAPCGQQMPPGGQLPQEMRNEVKDWIAAGAPDD